MNYFFEHVVKVFLFAFFGVLIPELCLILNSSTGVEMTFAPAAFTPLFCAAVSAGLAAAWSYVSKFFAKDIEDAEIEDIEEE